MTLLLETIEKHKRHHLKDKPIFIGGLSSRGKLSVHISNYIIGNKEFIEPKGVLIAASLIKFLALHKDSKINIEKQFYEITVQESNWIIDLFAKKF